MVSDKFIKKASAQKGKSKHLISLVGFSPEPIILTIRALQPEKVYFIATADTENQLNLIVEKCNLKPSQYYKEIVDSSRTVEVYAAIKKFSAGITPRELAIDITGGKKSMVGGGAEAGGILGCSVFYVDYAEYDKDLRKPKPGTEFLNFLENPYEVFGDLEIKRAHSLYEQGDYTAAIEILSQLIRRVPDPAGLEIKLQLVCLMQNWEDYQFAKALRNAENALELINRYRQLHNLKPLLDIKLQILGSLTGNEAEKWIIPNHLIISERYYQRGKFDFAILLLYRTLEMVFSYRLSLEYGIDASDPNYQKRPDLLDKYREVIQSIYQYNSRLPEGLPVKIGLMAAAMLLQAMDDQLVSGVSLSQINLEAEKRNKGILAHGVQPNTAKQYQSMAKAFLPIISRFLDVYFAPETLAGLREKYGIIPLQ
jgi:CRISPR-associated protein (TIGR02710 family)